MHAAIAAGEALVACGRAEQARALVVDWTAAAARHTVAMPWAAPVLSSMEGYALRCAGRPAEAVAVHEAVYARNAGLGSGESAAVEAAMLGYAWLARGRPATARRLMREAATLLRDGDAVGMRPWALAGIAQACAQAGDAAAARAALAEMEAAPLAHRGFVLDVELAHAWTAAAGGSCRARGRSRSRRPRGRWPAGRTASRSARSTRPAGWARPPIRCRARPARRRPPPPPPRLSRSPRASRGRSPRSPPTMRPRSPPATRPRSSTSPRSSPPPASASSPPKSAAAAATAFRDAGRESSARRAGARAAAWLGECEGARPPTLPAAGPAEELTPREREVALLAAGGSSSAEIAERLVVSVRTVDNHLQRAYGKLGIAGRHELAAALHRSE